MHHRQRQRIQHPITLLLTCLMALLILVSSVSAQPLNTREERDEIFMLAAYSIVLKGWPVPEGDVRGYNIGAVLVNTSDKIVCWARNSVVTTHDKTQHGEIRLITNYLHEYGPRSGGKLRGFRIYTTLEPCAMCSGMMIMTELSETIWGQADPSFGDAIERLAFNSQGIGGFVPYPRGTGSRGVPSIIRAQLESSYEEALRMIPTLSITDYLASDAAYKIYQEALQLLLTYELRYEENIPVLDHALQVVTAVPNEFQPLYYRNCCPLDLRTD